MFDPLDYARRDWLDLSGWPFVGAELAPWEGAAETLLGLAPTIPFDCALAELRQGFDDPDWDDGHLAPAIWQFSRRDENAEVHHFTSDTSELEDELAILRHAGRRTPMDFGRAHVDWLRMSKTVFLVTHATVTAVATDETRRRVTGVDLAGPDGGRHRLAGRAVVLACGGIDNARLLPSSPGEGASGLGNARDQVGRYLCDHTFSELGRYGPDGGRKFHAILEEEFPRIIWAEG